MLFVWYKLFLKCVDVSLGWFKYLFLIWCLLIYSFVSSFVFVVNVGSLSGSVVNMNVLFGSGFFNVCKLLFDVCFIL